MNENTASWIFFCSLFRSDSSISSNFFSRTFLGIPYGNSSNKTFPYKFPAFLRKFVNEFFFPRNSAKSCPGDSSKDSYSDIYLGVPSLGLVKEFICWNYSRSSSLWDSFRSFSPGISEGFLSPGFPQKLIHWYSSMSSSVGMLMEFLPCVGWRSSCSWVAKLFKIEQNATFFG